MSKKNVLIISYYWPPAGGPGVQRWLKFVKYLPEFNISPIVYIPENPNYPLLDKSLKTEVSNNVTIIKQPIKEPYKWANYFAKTKSKSISKGIIPEQQKQSFVEKLLLFIRGNFFIPDARKNWVKPSVNFLSKYIIDNNINTIITTGPPHSMHLIGLELQKKTNVKWLADFRDPWTTIGYHKELKLTKKSKRKHLDLEQKVLQTANEIIVTSQITKLEFKEKTKKPITVITNGYDVEKGSKVALDINFTIAHIGSLLSKRNPKTLWKVLQDLIAENQLFAKHFQLILVGAVSEVVLKSITAQSLNNYVKTVGYVSHDESIIFQRKSQLLLLIEIDSPETKCIIPGKLFEYMAANRPILAIGPEGSDVEKIINQTNTGSYFSYNSYESLKQSILESFNSFLKGDLNTNAVGLQKYSRRALTQELANLIHKS